VLQTLKWDVAAVTATDFVDVILCQLTAINCDESVVRHHALTFVVLSVLGNTHTTRLVSCHRPLYRLSPEFA